MCPQIIRSVFAVLSLQSDLFFCGSIQKSGRLRRTLRNAALGQLEYAWFSTGACMLTPDGTQALLT